eukprot:13073676-Ditylum_brightwellii.AAC.1
MESNLPNTYLFRVSVHFYVIMGLVLVGYTNVQAETIEQNLKLKLETDEALVIKTFENSLFGLKAGEGNTYCLWETSNQLGGMKVVLNKQLGTVEHQVRNSIRMNFTGHHKAQSI